MVNSCQWKAGCLKIPFEKLTFPKAILSAINLKFLRIRAIGWLSQQIGFYHPPLNSLGPGYLSVQDVPSCRHLLDVVQGPDLLGELLEQLVGRGEERVQQVVDSLLLQANGFSSIVAKVSGLLELCRIIWSSSQCLPN